jgi:putative nucleotidyltransferase with HDIG domain
LNTSLRRSDAVARYGGDEFIAVLPDTSAKASVQLVERIRATLESTPFDVGGGRIVPIKMSYGIATYPHDGHTASELLAAVDANLYRSKQRGGNFITASSSDDDFQPAMMGSFSVLDGLVTTVDKKDHYTRRHSDDVTELAVGLASKMGLSVETQRSVRMAGLLHDIGKVGVPDHILRKPADLDDEERKVVRNHVTLGELIIQGIPNQEEVVGAVSSHHERYDGKGYPRGLSGESIPLLGRILAVTDAYSAMTTDRPYRKALPLGEAKAELSRVAGTQLDPELVAAFLDALEEDEVSNETCTAVYGARRF